MPHACPQRCPSANRAYGCQRGDEADLFIRHADHLRSITPNEVRTSHATVKDACSFAWVALLRYQPHRETV